jgi:hypothetical protein
MMLNLHRLDPCPAAGLTSRSFCRAASTDVLSFTIPSDLVREHLNGAELNV